MDKWKGWKKKRERKSEEMWGGNRRREGRISALI